MPFPQAIKNIRSRIMQGPLKHGSFIRNVLTVAAGTAISQAIAIASIPLLARIFSPDDFGALASYMALAAVFGVAANLSYQAAIILPKREESAFTLLFSCLCISFIVSALLSLLAIIYPVEIASLLENPGMEQWLWLLPVGVLARGWFIALLSWNTRQKRFSNNAKGLITTRLFAVIAKLGASTVYLSGTGLVMGQVSGTAAGVVYLGNKSIREMPRNYLRSLSLKRILVLLHRYRRFPLYDLFSSTIAALVRNLPIILLTYFFAPKIAGYFLVAQRMVGSPLEVGASSVTQVFFQRANEANRANDLAPLALKAYQRLLAVFMTPLLLLCIAAPEFTLFLLGKDWAESGIYLSWLSIWLLFVSVASPMHKLFAILERQNELALINAMLFFISSASLIYGGLTDDPVFTIALFSCVSSAGWLLQGIRTLNIAGVSLAEYFSSMLSEILKTLPFIVVMTGTSFFSDSILVVVTVFILCLCVFGLTRVRFILGRGG